MARRGGFNDRLILGKFQSTRHLRGATVVEGLFQQGLVISIHAPLTWRDEQILKYAVAPSNFNPRATYVARHDDAAKLLNMLKFQSTRHLRGATRRREAEQQLFQISIHAPLTWRDG